MSEFEHGPEASSLESSAVVGGMSVKEGGGGYHSRVRCGGEVGVGRLEEEEEVVSNGR